MASEAFVWVDQNVGRVMGKETLSANGLFLETLFTIDGSRMSNKHSYRLTKSAGSSQSWLRKLKNGIPEDLELVVKTSRPESHLGEDEVFRGEALSLQAISFSDSFRTPHVLAFSDGWDGGFMVSEYVELVDTDKLNPATSELWKTSSPSAWASVWANSIRPSRSLQKHVKASLDSLWRQRSTGLRSRIIGARTGFVSFGSNASATSSPSWTLKIRRRPSCAVRGKGR